MGESYSLAIVWCHFFGQRALVKADALSVFEWERHPWCAK